MTILITGGAGYIGSHVALNLIDAGYKVTIIDDLSTGNDNLIPNNAEFIKCNINELEKIDSLLKKKKFSAIMHFAGLIKVEESFKKRKKYNLFNFIKAKIFFQTCMDNNLNTIIFSSTASVYGEKTKFKYNENSPKKPTNPYAKSKLRLEKFLIEKIKQKKLIV